MRAKAWAISAATAVTGAVVWLASAGPLDPPAGPIGPTGRTLDEVYAAVAALGPQGGLCRGLEVVPGGANAEAVAQFPFSQAAFAVYRLEFSGAGMVDPATGQQLGRTQFGRVVFTREPGADSPELWRVLDQGRVGASMRFDLRARPGDASGGATVIELANFVVVGVELRVEPRCDGSFAHLEEISLQAERISISRREGTTYTIDRSAKLGR